MYLSFTYVLLQIILKLVFTFLNPQQLKMTKDLIRLHGQDPMVQSEEGWRLQANTHLAAVEPASGPWGPG